MDQLIIALQIFLGLFTLLGIYDFIRSIFDAHVMKKAGAKCKVLICSCTDDVEYAVRFAESRFVLGEYADFFDGIALSSKVDIKNEDLNALNKEFGYNITLN